MSLDDVEALTLNFNLVPPEYTIEIEIEMRRYHGTTPMSTTFRESTRAKLLDTNLSVQEFDPH